MKVKRLVLDVLIPQDPSVLFFADKLSDMEKVDGVTIRVSEIDERTKSVEMTIEGEDLSIEDLICEIEDLGGSVHSIDSVSSGSRIV